VKRSRALSLFLITGIFAVAMGFLEAIVVVYLRELFYPLGFSFPLKVFSPHLYGIELIREAATLVMLLMVGILAGKSRTDKFAFFLYSFGVWDIVYYIALKLFLNWPEGFLTWDLLFLIPVTWIGPVIAPVICSVTMIILAGVLVLLRRKRNRPLMDSVTWILLVSGSFLVFLSFIRDYTLLLLRNGLLRDLQNLFYNDTFRQVIESFVPERFDWVLFGAGEILLIAAIARIVWKQRR